MKAFFVDKDGTQKPMVMGCYGIGVSRIVAATIEGNFDEKGIVWPLNIAPFKVLVLPVNVENTDIVEISEKIYSSFVSADIEVLLDDIDVSTGAKFAEADLTGIPLWVVVGKKISEGKVEIKIRKENKLIPIDVNNVLPWVVDYIKQQENG